MRYHLSGRCLFSGFLTVCAFQPSMLIWSALTTTCGSWKAIGRALTEAYLSICLSARVVISLTYLPAWGLWSRSVRSLTRHDDTSDASLFKRVIAYCLCWSCVPELSSIAYLESIDSLLIWLRIDVSLSCFGALISCPSWSSPDLALFCLFRLSESVSVFVILPSYFMSLQRAK